MICPGCKLDTPADKKFCEFCGIALDLDFEKVEESFGQEIEIEQQKKTEATLRRWFILACFLCITALLGRQLVTRPETPEGVGPEFLSPISVKLPKPLPLEPIGQEIPKGKGR